MKSRIAPAEYARAFLDATKDASRDDIRKRAEVLYALLKRDHNEHLFPQIIEEAEKSLNAAEGMSVKVTSAAPLTPAQKNTLGAAISEEADTVRFEEHIDPTLGAGIRMQIGDTVIDATMQGRLAQLRKALLSSY